MRLTRREFLAAASTLMPLARVLAIPDEAGFTALRAGVGHFTGRGGTIGWLATDDALLVVDTQFPESAEQCWNGLRSRTDHPLDLVLNTHHHGDHTSGNAFFRQHTAHIVAHRNVPTLQRQASGQQGGSDEGAYADVTFDESWEQDLGGEQVRMRHYGPAHTGGDAIVHFVNADVVHTGDLVFNRTTPYIDRPAGASIQNWITSLETIHDDYTDDTIFIFGHSNPAYPVSGTRADLLVMRNFLSGLLDYVRKGIQENKDAEELASIDAIPGFPEHRRDDNREVLANGIRTAHAELTETP